jgi:hypothetical protein
LNGVTRRVDERDDRKESLSSETMLCRCLILLCAALCIIGGANSVVAPDAARRHADSESTLSPSWLSSASRRLRSAASSIARLTSSRGVTYAWGSATGTSTSISASTSNGGVTTSGTINSGPGTAFLGTVNDGTTGIITTDAQEFNAAMAAMQAQHTADVSAVTAGIVSGGATGGLITTSAGSRWAGTAPSCIDAPKLTVTDVESAGLSLLGLNSFAARTPTCAGSTVWSANTGAGCKHAQRDLFSKLYDTGVSFMMLGADQEEAFAAYRHAWTLAWALRICEPAANPSGTVALPHGYAVLYDMLGAKLMARLNQSGRMARRTPTEADLNTVLQAIAAQRSAALGRGLHLSVDAALLPTAATVWGAVRTTARASLMTGAYSSLNTETTQGAKMTEQLCDRDVPSETSYSLKALTGFSLDSRYEVCCASECLLVGSTTRSLTGSTQNCCVGCNRFKCSALGDSGVSKLSSTSKVSVPAKEDASPAVVSIAV